MIFDIFEVTNTWNTSKINLLFDDLISRKHMFNEKPRYLLNFFGFLCAFGFPTTN